MSEDLDEEVARCVGVVAVTGVLRDDAGFAAQPERAIAHSAAGKVTSNSRPIPLPTARRRRRLNS
jgi:hypothetical protein